MCVITHLTHLFVKEILNVIYVIYIILMFSYKSFYLLRVIDSVFAPFIHFRSVV